MDSYNSRSATSLPRIRVLSLGNCGVGKSCLIKRYCEQRFVQRYLPTIGIDYGSTTVEVDDRRVSVHFFDTSGSPLFEEVRTEFYPDMQGVMLVYDVTDKASFVALDHWMAELRHNLGQTGVEKLVLVVAGTRSDTGGSVNGRQVSEGEGRAWASRHGAHHVVTSAALGTGITLAFTTLFSAALQLKESHGPTAGTSSNTFASGSKPNTNNRSSSNLPRNNSSSNNTSSGSKSSSSTNNNSNSKTSTGSQGTKATPGATSGGGKGTTSAGPTKSTAVDPETAAAIHRLLHSSDNLHKMQLTRRGLTKDEVNKAYRRLAGVVHPDKCKAPGAEEAFKMLAQARTAVLGLLTETTV